MSKIDDVQRSVQNYFNYLSGPTYVRLLDTPHVWGQPFGKAIMPQAWARQAEFERAISEIVQKARYRCDLASLNSPDPDWVKPILGAMDTALTQAMGRTQPTQFRFLFGQTPMNPFTEPENYTDFKAALIRLVRYRSQSWEKMPEIWLGRFYRLQEGILSALQTKVFGDSIISNDDTKMTWNHAKIIAMDGTEALVGGHNLNMDLFRSYPPVHDVSVVVHGDAAYGAQLFLNKMWECGTDLLTKEHLDVSRLAWVNDGNNRSVPVDPLRDAGAAAYMSDRQRRIVQMHQSGVQDGVDNPAPPPRVEPTDMRAQDLQTLADVAQAVFPERTTYNSYDKFQDYKLATRILSVGKYWNGPNLDANYQKGSELMKEQLIRNASSTIRMSQMDLISAWKKNWSDHVVCQWLMAALLANQNLSVQVVVSPLDAGAGAEGDQYSFGSGAVRTFDLIKYYMTHDANTDAPLADPDGTRANALSRLQIAPFYYTDGVPSTMTGEGVTYKWPDLTPEGYTATLKQPPLSVAPPSQGVIGSAAWAVVNASGKIYARVPSAPGNHAKIMIVDDELYVVGSDNLYPGSLSEFNYLIEGPDAVNELLNSYWRPLWQYSGPHTVTPQIKRDTVPQAAQPIFGDLIGHQIKVWTADFSGAGHDQILFYNAESGNWWLGDLVNGQLQWNMVSASSGFGNLLDGQHPIWIADFTGAGHSQVLFYFNGDGNWWLGDLANGQLQWTMVSASSGFGNLLDGQHPIWIADFTGAGHSQVMFYFNGDGNWWLGSMGNGQLQWTMVSASGGFGNLLDGQHAMWMADFTGAGHTQVLFYFAGDGNWWLGNLAGGQLQWTTAGQHSFGNLAGPQIKVWTADFTGTGHDQVLLYNAGDGNWWLGDLVNGQLQWTMVSASSGFGNLLDGQHPIWTADFIGAGHNQVLFYFVGDGNWWLGDVANGQLQWTQVSAQTGFGNLVDDQHPTWIEDFSGVGHSQVMFYFAGDGNWWLGDMSAGQLQWGLASESAGFGDLLDGQHAIWLADFAEAGHTQVLFYYTGDGSCWLGDLAAGQLQWTQVYVP